jgi:NRAMP (natural resistance-associated macrophage protein)-like metal ion transporter
MPESRRSKQKHRKLRAEAGTTEPVHTKKRKGVLRLLAILGPGLVTGAADDDPSGIFTYSQAGAQFGLTQLWTAVFMLPLMIAVQEMCARIAIVTGSGITTVIKQHYSKAWLYSIVGMLLVANTINLGVDLGAMAEAAKLLVPVRYGVAVVIFALLLIGLEIAVPYRRYAPILKWLTISLFAYVITCIIVTRSWIAVLKATFIPQLHFSFEFMMIIVGILGTTISPYMFFWQASQEKEEFEERVEAGQRHIARRFALKNMRIDTVTGMLFSEITAWCIILTTGEVLHANGVTDIKSAAQAASAIEPLVRTFPHAGKISEVLFALGILGTGALAVPIFAATSSYALSELMGWREGLALKFSQAPRFYLAIVAGTVIGICINVLGVDPIKALVYTAVLNGVVAVPMIFLLIRITGNKQIMGRNTSGRLGSTLSWITFAAMGLAAVVTVYALMTGR